MFLFRAPPTTPQTAFLSDPETGPLVNPTCAGTLKVSVSTLIGKFSLDALIAWPGVPGEWRSLHTAYSVVREVGIRLRNAGAVGSCVELNAFRCRRLVSCGHPDEARSSRCISERHRG